MTNRRHKPSKRVVGDTFCPECRKNGRDSSGNHLMLYADGGGYCNRCGHIVPKTRQQLTNDDETEQDIMTPDLKLDYDQLSSSDIPDRKIKKSVVERYGVKVGISCENGEPLFHAYPVSKEGTITGWKQRLLPKEFRSDGDTKGKVDLFGQRLFTSGKKLLITGGELDAMAAYQMLYEKYTNFEPSVVSLPKGENISAVAENLKYLENFEEILICTDMDDVGRECAAQLCDLIGPKAKIVSFSEKDASDMLVAGKQAEFINAFFNAKVHAPDGFVTVDDVFDEATAMPQWGRNWPWPSLTKLTYGRRDGEGIFFGAGVKIGKSEAVNQIAHHITQVEKGKIALFKLEEKPAMTVRRLAGKLCKKPFHKPDGDFTQQELIDGVNRVRGGVVLYDSYGSTDWDKLKSAIRHAVIVEGCKDIVIDPLTRLTVGMDASEANTELERISDELSIMAKDLGFFYMIFCHLKAPTSGPPHERGGKVLSSQFTGSRAMMRACYYMLGIERNKDPELPEVERNMSTFVLLEDRAFGNAGSFEVFYDNETGEYAEPKPVVGAF